MDREEKCALANIGVFVSVSSLIYFFATIDMTPPINLFLWICYFLILCPMMFDVSMKYLDSEFKEKPDIYRGVEEKAK